MTFDTIVFVSGNNTGIEVPAAVVEALGGGKRPAVTITIGSYSYRSTVAPMGGKYLIPLSAERRAEAGLRGGDAITVELTLDTTPREVAVPDDLAAALAREPAGQAFFNALSYSNRLRHVLSVTDAKTPETRTRRIEKVVGVVLAGKK